MLYGIMQKAEANELIRRNPVALADKVKVDFSESHKDSFTAEEIQRLFLYLPNDRMGLSIRLLIGTGMRSQELLGLEPEHIEPDGSVIHVRQAVTMTKRTPEIGPTKTRNSIRDIPVPTCLRKVAMELRNTDQKYIWHGETTPICNPSVFRKHFKKALIEVGKVRLLSPHACRHTYVSQLQRETEQSPVNRFLIDIFLNKQKRTVFKCGSSMIQVQQKRANKNTRFLLEIRCFCQHLANFWWR